MTFFHVCKSPTVLCSFRRVSAFIASCRRARGLISVLTQAWPVSTLFTGAQKFVAVFTGHRRLITIVTEFHEKLRRCKSHWLRRETRITNNSVAKVMMNYGSNGRRGLGRPLKTLLDEAETGLSRCNSWRMMMTTMTRTTTTTMMMILKPAYWPYPAKLRPVFVPARSRPPGCLFTTHSEVSFHGPFHQSFPARILHASFISHTRCASPTYLRCQILINLLISEALFDASQCLICCLHVSRLVVHVWVK